MNRFRTSYTEVPVAKALDFDWSGYHLSEKMDGRWNELAIGRSVVAGELMADGRFFAFDVPVLDGRDVRREPKAYRLELLDSFPLLRPAVPQPGETAAHFIQRVLDSGGEGVVGAALDAPWGAGVYKAKRQQTFDCTVTGKRSGALQLHLNGECVGWCPCCCQTNYNALRFGDVVEVVAYGRHPSGKLREARLRLDRLGRPVVRRDKMEAVLPVRPNSLSGESLSLTISI